MTFSLPYTFCLHFYLIKFHIFDYPDSRLSGLFTEVPTSPDNRGSTVSLIKITAITAPITTTTATTTTTTTTTTTITTTTITTTIIKTPPIDNSNNEKGLFMARLK